MDHYQRPDWFTKNVFNRGIALLTRIGISVYGSRILAVQGRRSGEWRRTPVNLLVLDGQGGLVAPRGDTQGGRNLRAAREGRVLVGRRPEQFRATEVPEHGRPPVLRRYHRT